MQVMYDSLKDTLTKTGQHNGEPRLWTVVIRPTFENGETPKWTFRTKGKRQVRELADEIDTYLRAQIVINRQTLTRMRWTAIAR